MFQKLIFPFHSLVVRSRVAQSAFVDEHILLQLFMTKVVITNHLKSVSTCASYVAQRHLKIFGVAIFKTIDQLNG